MAGSSDWGVDEAFMRKVGRGVAGEKDPFTVVDWQRLSVRRILPRRFSAACDFVRECLQNGRDRPPGGLANGRRMDLPMKSSEIPPWSVIPSSFSRTTRNAGRPLANGCQPRSASCMVAGNSIPAFGQFFRIAAGSATVEVAAKDD